MIEEDPNFLLPKIDDEEVTSALDDFLKDPSLELPLLERPPHLDFDEWKAKGFSAIKMLPPADREKVEMFRSDLMAKAISDPKSIEAEVLVDMLEFERLNAANLKAVSADGWRPAWARKPFKRRD